MRTRLDLSLRIALLAGVAWLASSWSGHPAGAQEVQRISPPPQYQEWFDEVSACVSADKPFLALSWWVVEGTGWYDETGDFILGSYYWMTRRVYLAKELMMAEALVKHEMMHYLVDPYGNHPSPPYQQCEYETSPSWRSTP